MSAEQLYKEIHPIKYFRDYLQNEIRPDGRDLAGTRPLQLNIDSIHTADGSATVKLGNTIMVCGIKAELAQPLATTPDVGYFVPNIELTPLCSPRFRPGPPSEVAQVLSCALCDIIENSGCLDLKQLCIVKEKLVWTLYCDIVCLNHDGCALDAAVIAAIAALRSVRLPSVIYNVDTSSCDVDERKNKQHQLSIKATPISTTFMVFDGKVITDPTAEEETLAKTFVTVSVCDSQLSYIYKPGGSAIEPQILEECVKQAVHREKKVRQLLENVEKSEKKLK